MWIFLQTRWDKKFEDSLSYLVLKLKFQTFDHSKEISQTFEKCMSKNKGTNFNKQNLRLINRELYRHYFDT